MSHLGQGLTYDASRMFFPFSSFINEEKDFVKAQYIE